MIGCYHPRTFSLHLEDPFLYHVYYVPFQNSVHRAVDLDDVLCGSILHSIFHCID